MRGIRTFIAVELADAVRQEAAELVRALSISLDGIKWVEPQNQHLTLKFLGDVDPADVARVCKETAAAASAARPFEISVEGVGTFPPKGSPRVIWVGVVGGLEPLHALCGDLEDRFAAMGFRKERKRFTPHVTIARVRERIDVDLLRSRIEDFVGWVGGRQSVGELVVFSSELSRAGPTHTAMARCRLR